MTLQEIAALISPFALKDLKGASPKFYSSVLCDLWWYFWNCHHPTSNMMHQFPTTQFSIEWKIMYNHVHFFLKCFTKWLHFSVYFMLNGCTICEWMFFILGRWSKKIWEFFITCAMRCHLQWTICASCQTVCMKSYKYIPYLKNYDLCNRRPLGNFGSFDQWVGHRRFHEKCSFILFGNHYRKDDTCKEAFSKSMHFNQF